MRGNSSVFKETMKDGRFFRSNGFVLYYLPKEVTTFSVAFSKKINTKSVDRHRIKRLIYNAVSLIDKKFMPKASIVILCLRSFDNKDKETLLKDISQVLLKIA